jgi:thiamine biosynthesis protein ThiS
MAEIVINGDLRSFADGMNLTEVIESLAMPHGRVAIELNGTVVRRTDWDETTIADGDRLEVVHFVGGG